MKKLYRKGTVHPTLTVSSDHHLLSFLPAAILTLTVALSTEEREVLAYLISCSSANFSGNHRKTAADHSPCFNCNCFRCYMSYWVKWDISPNRQLIHEIIDSFEDSLLKEGSKKEKNKRRKGKIVKVDDEPKLSLVNEDLGFVESKLESEVNGEGFEVEEEENEDDLSSEKGSVRRFVSFIGERIWSVLGLKKLGIWG